jgi:hypothetical protein
MSKGGKSLEISKGDNLTSRLINVYCLLYYSLRMTTTIQVNTCNTYPIYFPLSKKKKILECFDISFSI